jgi:hypothetical protein
MIIQPTWLGQPWYPGGFPLKPEQVHAGSKSIQDIYWEHSQSNGKHPDHEETLKSYSVYYLNAPIFDNELTQEIKAKDLMQMSFDDVWRELMDCGLDPF